MRNILLTEAEAGILNLMLLRLLSKDAIGETYLANGSNPIWERSIFLRQGELDILARIEEKLKGQPESKPKRKQAGETKPTVSDEFIEAMEQKYQITLGESVRDEIAAALNHKSVLKAMDKQLYVKRWLTRAATFKNEGKARDAVAHSKASTPGNNDHSQELRKWRERQERLGLGDFNDRGE